MYKYHVDFTKPADGEILVFGSNLAGIHGAGSAHLAVTEFGAVMGKGVGLHGNSYAVPTKDEQIITLPIFEIVPHITDFMMFTHKNKDKKFFITRVGCGLAGYTDRDIAPFFRFCYTNCDFPIEWKPFLE